MKLTQKALKAINNKTTHARLALALNYSADGIKKLIRLNKENGPLTTYTALEVIREDTRMRDEQILEGSPIPSL